MKLKLIDKKELATDTFLFVFKPVKSLTWKAGQFLRYKLPNPSADDRGENRFFSISSAPFEKNVYLTIKFVPEKALPASRQGSTFKKDLQKLEVGMEIESTGPYGEFTLEDPTGEYVFIAGGIGVTPFRAIFLELNHQNKNLPIKLLYANRTKEVVFKNDLEEVAKNHPEFSIEYFISDEKIAEERSGNLAYHMGQITEQALNSLISDLTKPTFYISGPEPMVQNFEKMLKKMGVSEEHIKRDYFPGYKDI